MEELIIDESYVDSNLIDHKGQKYPRIVIEDNLVVKPSVAPEHLTDVFLQIRNNYPKQLFYQYRTKGFVSMLNFIKESYYNNDCQSTSRKNSVNNICMSILYYLTIFILYIRLIYLNIHFYFYPFDKLSDNELLEEFSLNPSWKSNTIRAFAWHSKSLRCALALINDLIYVYAGDINGPINHIVCLKNIHQRKISVICWHPIRDDILVVACKEKILIWSLLSDMSKFKLDSGKCQVIDSMIQSPITSLAFNDTGDQLVACSPRNSSLSIIKFENPIKTQVVRKLFLPQFTSLNWCPGQTRLFVHTTMPKVCLFESKQWSYKCWPLPDKKYELCQTSAWSRPSGRILLFVPRYCSKIYALTFYDQAVAGDVGGHTSNKPIVVLDTRQQSNSKQYENIIHQICWNSSSTILGVSFQDRLDMVSIYATKLNPGLQIGLLCVLKSGFTSNLLHTRCLFLTFHDNYTDSGSLLTICWSNGYVTHIPLQSQLQQKQELSTENNLNTLERTNFTPNYNSPIRSLTSLCTSFKESDFTQTPPIMNGNTNRNKSTIFPVNKSPFNQENYSPSMRNLKNNDKISLTQSSSPILSTNNLTTPKRATLYSTRINF